LKMATNYMYRITPNLKPYPSYKDSGVEWLGKVPEHWEVRRIKRIAHINPSKSEVPLTLRNGNAVFLPMERVGTNGHYDASDVRPILSLWNGFTYFRRGDIIVAKITPCFENGKGACLENLPTAIGFGSTEFHVIRPSKAIVTAHLYHLTTLSDFRRLGTDEMTGAAGQQRVPVEFIANFPIPIPPLPEQNAIVRFLDYMDRRIKRYINAKQKMIKLLSEYKQALIHQAVTGKIDVRTGKPYPSYKDSGVEWLGKVPEHWEVRRLKTVVDHINEQTSSKTDEDIYIALEHVESWTGRILVPSEEMQFESQVKRFRTEDVLFGKLRPYLAKVFCAKQGGVCVSEFFVLRARPIASPNYIEMVLRSPTAIDFINSSTYGAKMPRADWMFVGTMLFPLPPLPEQTAIVAYLDDQTEKIDTAIASTRKEIELLREYRERLIADVVTGKVDVREVAELLPEEAEEDIIDDGTEQAVFNEEDETTNNAENELKEETSTEDEL